MAFIGCGEYPWAFTKELEDCCDALDSVLGHLENRCDLLALLAVGTTVDWSRVDLDNLGGVRPVASMALENSRIGPGWDFVGMNPWTGRFLTCVEWLDMIQSALTHILVGFSCDFD